jgi:type I site-specific restriction endonuclease
MFVEFDRETKKTTDPKPISYFHTPEELQNRCETAVGFKPNSLRAKPMLMPYKGGEAIRRYYQDAAIRAVLEKLSRGEKRALISLATGAGKTFIAVNLLFCIADAGQLRRALFLSPETIPQGRTARRWLWRWSITFSPPERRSSNVHTIAWSSIRAPIEEPYVQSY